MIGYLEGTPIAVLPDSVVLLTAGGVGYRLFLPAPLLARRMAEGETLRFHVSTVVRDNEISLYGFEDLRGRSLFETLLKVSGVGPKLALGLLSAFTPAELVTAVARDDIALLSSIPGIGKKTATRLCLELKERLAKWSGAATPASRSGDLVSALTNLGFPEKEVFAAVRQIPPEAASFSDQLKQALALLAKR